jgi:hypothetical protein
MCFGEGKHGKEKHVFNDRRLPRGTGFVLLFEENGAVLKINGTIAVIGYAARTPSNGLPSLGAETESIQASVECPCHRNSSGRALECNKLNRQRASDVRWKCEDARAHIGESTDSRRQHWLPIYLLPPRTATTVRVPGS